MTTVSFHIPESTHKAAVKVAKDLGFRSLSALIRWSLDETLQRQGIYEEIRTRSAVRKPVNWHRTNRAGSLRSRIEAMPIGQEFTANDIIRPDEDRASVGIQLHYMHRTGAIGLRRNAHRVPGKGWEPAVFVRTEAIARDHGETGSQIMNQ